MNQFDHKLSASLLGTGIYSVSEASRLTGVSSSRIRRWLSGHHAGGKHYDRLWKSQIQIGEETFLGFRDLTEARVAAAFISAGLPAQKIRRAIEIAREKYGIDRPLSTNSFRTDGKTVFLVLAAETGEGVVDVLGDQFVFKKIIEPSLKGLVFD
ncbi:MAG TPA: hypothetical protein PKE65_08600, partial [Rhizobiaceae bacterium]|nr:hypothetical protein [Rhizobiaceae bacterium]